MLHGEKYKDFTDNELVEITNGGDQEAMEYLLEKYKNLVKKKARALFLIGGDNDDLIQEGMIGLYKAVRDYNCEKDNSFYNFADLCITRQIYSAIKAARRKKHIPLNSYVSFYSPVFLDAADEISLEDIFFSNDVQNPESLLIGKENANRIEKELEEALSKLEKKVLQLYLNGLGYVQIAAVLEKEPKSIDNALQRIRAKLNVIVKTI